MLKISALYSRLLFFIALVCAAVMSFIMCSDAARASPITTNVDDVVKHNVLRQLYTQYSQPHPPSTGLPSTETGFQRGTNSDTETSRDYREALSIIDYQSKPPRFTDGSFGYNQNIPDNRQSQAGINGLQSRLRSASSIFTSHPQHGGQSFERRQSRVNYHPLSQEVAQSGNSYYSHPVIIRKSSHKETGSPFHQSSRPSHVWDPKDAQKSYSKEKVPKNDSPKVAEDETVWQPPDSSLLSSQTGGWRASLPISRGHYSGYKETNEPAVVVPRSTSSGIQSSQFLGFASQTASRAQSIRSGLDASVIKSNPSPEKLTSSITDFSQGSHSVGSSETPTHKKIQSYLFKDSQTSSGGHETISTLTGYGHGAFTTTAHEQRPSDAQVYGWFSSNFKQLQQSQKEEPTKEVQHLFGNANPLYHNVNVAQYGAQTDIVNKYQRSTAETLTQMSEHSALGTDNAKESADPVPHADFQGNYASGSEKSVSLVNTTASGSLHANKPGQTIKSIYGFRGFKNPLWGAVKGTSVFPSSSSNERPNSQRYSFDKGKFKIANIYPSLSPKYRFGQREASTTPAKLKKTPTYYSSPSPGTLDTVKTMTTSRPFTSGFKEAQPLLPESDAVMDSNPDRRQFRIHRKTYGLKGFGNQPLGGAKPLVSEPDKSARVHQSLEGFKLRSSQIWQPKHNRLPGWDNKTEPGVSHVSTMNQNEQSSEDLKPFLMRAGNTEADTRFTPDKYKKIRKVYTHLGFHPVQERIVNADNKTLRKYKEQNPTTESASRRISSAYLRSAWDRTVESSPKSELRAPNKTKPAELRASLLNSSTRSTVRGKRVKAKYTEGKKLNESASLANDAGNEAIVRLPKRPARVRAVMYADILGSASFSGVRTTTQTPTSPADKDYFPNTIVTQQAAGASHWTLNSEVTVHGRDDSRGPETHAEDEGDDFTGVEEKELGVRSEEVESDTKTLDLFRDNEGSGSGSFNMSDVFSTDTTKSQGLDEDSLELDYLQISTGNISFKSMKLSHTEK